MWSCWDVAWTIFRPISRSSLHESAGVDCCGCIVPTVKGQDAELQCNECGTVVGVVQVGILKDLVSLIPEVA